ncbi:MAG: hypothetical protein P8Z67_16205 [Gammaproteobacteria bacterium]
MIIPVALSFWSIWHMENIDKGGVFYLIPILIWSIGFSVTFAILLRLKATLVQSIVLAILMGGIIAIIAFFILMQGVRF